MKKIEEALSNEVYFENESNMIFKYYIDDKFKKAYGNQELKILNKLNYKNNKGKKNLIKIEYFEHEKFDDSNISLGDILKVSDTLKQLHKVNTKGIKITPFEKVYKKFLLKGFGSKEGWFNDKEKYIHDKAIEILKSDKQVILHNDLVEGNLLKVKNRIKLIDFEYSGLGNPIFDAASFLTERELDDKQINIFIDSYYYKFNKEDLIIVSAFLQIFWTRWAMYKYKLTNKKVYKDIYTWKFEKYKEIINKLNI